MFIAVTIRSLIALFNIGYLQQLNIYYVFPENSSRDEDIWFAIKNRERKKK